MDARRDLAGSRSFERLTKALARRPALGGVPATDVDADGLARGVALLPPLAAEIIERCDLEGLPRARVARELGYSARHFYRLRRRALASLARILVDARAPERPCFESSERGPQSTLATGLSVSAQARLGRCLLVGDDGLARLLHAPQARPVLAPLCADATPSPDVFPLVRRLAQLAADELPARLRTVALGVAEERPAREVARSVGVSLRHMYRLRREADAAVWDAFCRHAARQRTGASCTSAIESLVRQATTFHQNGESERARRALQAAFHTVTDRAARRALLLRLVDFECDAWDFPAARSALKAFDAVDGASAAPSAERQIATALFELRSGTQTEHAQLLDALRTLEADAPRANERTRASALVQGYALASEIALMQGKFRAASLAAERALELCDRIDDVEPILLARALHSAGASAALRLGHLAGGIGYLQRGYEWCVRGYLRRERVATVHGLGGAYMLIGDYPQACERYEQALRSAEFLTPDERFAVRVDHAAALVHSGRIGPARALLAKLHGQSYFPLAATFVELTRAEIELAAKAWQAARRSAVEAARTSGISARTRASARCVEAEALCGLGRLDEAKRACFEVLEAFSDTAHPAKRARAFRLAARLTGSTAYRRAAEEIREEFAGAFA
jgi:tetratricopeptide (TPR) repeat protein